MSNSAWSGNTSGLASAVSPGLVGTGAQTFAGDKTLTGLTTASGGIINTGLTGANATTVTTSGSGKVGETVTSAKVQISGASSTGATVGTLALGAGVWAVSFSGAVTDSAGIITTADWAIALTQNVSLNPATSGYYTDLETYIGANGYVPSPGSGRIRGSASKVVYINTTATTYYLRASYIVAGGGSIGLFGYGQAIRIA